MMMMMMMIDDDDDDAVLIGLYRYRGLGTCGFYCVVKVAFKTKPYINPSLGQRLFSNLPPVKFAL